MDKDLKLIKENFGEDFALFCSKKFEDILKYEGLLSSTLLNLFYPNQELYKDLLKNNLILQFKKYIYSILKINVSNRAQKTPDELFNGKGYELRKIINISELSEYRKFYTDSELPEIFNEFDNYNKEYDIFIAIKNNAEKLNRSNYFNPSKHDKYATSLMILLFKKDAYHDLKIINRYNKNIDNYDTTYNNNLDNIVKGLNASFDYYYGIRQVKFLGNKFEIPGYIFAQDGKMYKYNYKINGVSYCKDNIIIDTFGMKKLNNDYILMDYFVVDLNSNKIYLYDSFIEDGFSDFVLNIESIDYNGDFNLLNIRFTGGEYARIVLDKDNKIVSINSNISKDISDYFLRYNNTLRSLSLNNVQKIGKKFLNSNEVLDNLSLDKTLYIDDYFLTYNKDLDSLILPNVRYIGKKALYFNNKITSIDTPNIQVIHKYFMKNNTVIGKKLSK